MLALLCSFSVYFIPTVVGPHGIHLVLDDIWQQFREFKNPAWAFRNLGVAVGLQTAAFALFYWFWRLRTLLSFAALFICSVAAIVLTQFVYMLWLPSRFLIEAETAAETGTWVEACHVADASVMTLRTPRRLPAWGWGEAWLGDSQNRKWLLRMPDCQRIAATLPQPHMEPGGRVDFLIGIAQVVPGGLALVQREDIGNPSKPVWYLLDTATGTLNALPAPDTTEIVGPYLSDDGLRTAWIVPITGSGPPRLDTLRVLPLEPGAREQLLDLSPFGPASYEVRVRHRVGRRAALGSDTIVLTAHGVVAWDAYKEDDNYAIAWSMDTGSGVRRIPRGSSIVAAAADPSGRYVAVSTSTTLNIGYVMDSVFVMSAVDGHEVFRRFLPKYSRTNVVFLGDEYFVYSDATTTHVMRMGAR